MRDDHVRETCGCGAVWEGNNIYHDERAAFRAAHTPCRPNAPSWYPAPYYAYFPPSYYPSYSNA